MLTRNCLLLFLWILVDEGSAFSSRPPLLPLGQSRKGREHARSSAGPMRNGANRFQRVKRGWVWNQFFVLEEYMGSDPQYVGKLISTDGTTRGVCVPLKLGLEDGRVLVGF
ncbi:Cadherin-12 Brain cadherin [Takifugu flavidus]|uniref:Cadherin-12 Brain cadherin n=1 Tax=Takifugu flavidus TaxID=433684 RepID=A0A5C6NTU1_9TELE|nr:Cadherin-12 Brain cadherin [Takifugu flavidus]